ncbi:MAG: UDP-N-acetylmuramoyl-tripeptide--D-alanyl-D-alanine ligase, partial [Ruminiclostridium sp.]|nr:UDP-N-acetylmuramoyl-tripeptide--D-alanyl-D-alanine ligase [Ruminiclostridium sp.]
MEPMRVRELLAATGGTLIGTLADPDTVITSVETDSRAVKAGALFVALRGEQTDGHRYIPGALGNGAAGCLTEEELPEYLPDKFYIKVPSTLEAIGHVAKAYKEKFPIPVIGVTGSVGKTTTKDMIASVLGMKYRVLKTDGNFNNELGLPLTLFRLTPEDQICVLEMGMSAFGEIDYLTKIVAPDVAVITNVGDAHIENLGSREGILQAKMEIFNYMNADGLGILCGDDDMLRTVEGKVLTPVVYCGAKGSPPYEASDLVQLGAYGMRCTVRTPGTCFDVTIPAPGSHMIYPTLMACAVGERFGLTGEELKAG